MAASLVARLRSLPGALRTSYGMTELGLYVTYSAPDADLDTLSRTIGKPHPGFDIRVADEHGAVARPGEQGEIQARGDWLLAGYFRDPQASADAYTPDGWFRTGRRREGMARRQPWRSWGARRRCSSPAASTSIRAKSRSRSKRIPTLAWWRSSALPTRPSARSAMPSSSQKPGRTLEAASLHDWCRERLANYKTPRRFEIRAELPRLPIGKIDKQALKRELAEHRG